jgi:WS/DGAT/MGAT family acyltransferase
MIDGENLMSPSYTNSELFSSVDAAWFHMDTPTNLAVITGVITFDSPLDFERLKITLERRLVIHRRFRQRVREPILGVGPPCWEYDPAYAIENHVERVQLPEPGDRDALQRLVAEYMSTPLDPARPLWKFHLIEHYQAGSALICRLHHCIADGLALVQILLSTADEEPNAPLPEEVDLHFRQLSPLARLFRPAVKAALDLRRSWRASGDLLHEGMETIVEPSRLMQAARYSRDASKALGKLLLIPPDRQTVLRGSCGVEKRTVWTEGIDLDEIKAIGGLMGGTVNDILLTAATGALRRYLEGRGDAVDGLDIRVIVPVNLRPPDDLELFGNRFGLVFLSLPVGVQDPLRRLVVLRQRMDAIKASPEAVVALGILATIGVTPTQIEDLIVTIFGMKGSAVMTNVPGPKRPLYLAGSKINNLMFWVPMPGNLSLGLSILSYAGKVVVGIASDAVLIPDPEVILDAFNAEFEQMRRWGRPPGKDIPLSPKSEPAPAKGQLGSGSPEILQKPDDPMRCQALTKSGLRCKNRALPNSTTCRIHQGQTF